MLKTFCHNWWVPGVQGDSTISKSLQDWSSTPEQQNKTQQNKLGPAGLAVSQS